MPRARALMRVTQSFVVAIISITGFIASVAFTYAADWSGFYVGANTGYSSRANRGLQLDGIFGEVTAGYNYAIGGTPFFTSLEINLDAASINGERTTRLANGYYCGRRGIRFCIRTPLNETLAADFRSTAIVLSRLGVTIDRTALYVAAGFAAANDRSYLRLTTARTLFEGKESRWHKGFVSGAGIERKTDQHWSVKLEYLYTSFGREEYFDGVFLQPLSFTLQLHTVRAGVSYAF